MINYSFKQDSTIVLTLNGKLDYVCTIEDTIGIASIDQIVIAIKELIIVGIIFLPSSLISFTLPSTSPESSSSSST